jgi:hypothetical protein
MVITALLLSVFMWCPAGYAQQEVNCNPIVVLTKPGEEAISLTILNKLKGPRLVYPACDTARTDLAIHRFSIYLLHGTEIQYMSYKSGKGAGFDKADIAALNLMADGDVIFITDITSWSATSEESSSPIRLKVTNDNPKKQEAEAGDNEMSLLVRTIVLGDTVLDSTTKKKILRPNSALANKLIDAVKSGKARASAYGIYNAQNVLSAADIKKIFADKVDSIRVENIDGAAIIKTVTIPFNYDNVRGFRVLEQVSADEETGKDEMEILAIAPVCDYLDDDGKLWGNRPLFWIKYEDIEEVITEFEARHSKLKLIAAIKADYQKVKARTVKKKVVKPEEDQDKEPVNEKPKSKAKAKQADKDQDDDDDEG